MLFFLYLPRDHPHLHSFPTRRSSDLATALSRHDHRPRHAAARWIPSLAKSHHVDRFNRSFSRLPPSHSFHYRCRRDRKSTRLNSSHITISYAVFCLKKKNIILLHIHI